MNRKRPIVLLSSLMLLFIQAFSQVPFTVKDTGSEFLRGMELFAKQKYPSAIKLFDSYLAANTDSKSNEAAEAEYHAAMAALSLFNPDAEYRMIKFIRSYPESPRINEAYLALGDYFYQNRNYRKAALYFEEVRRWELTPAKLSEYFFRLGYSLMIRGDKPEAMMMFSEIKDIDTEYTSPALYYFSHLAYEQNMYETAMDGFLRLRDDETFGGVVPFYIVQMLYLKKDYDQILTIAPQLIESAGSKRELELYRFIGDAYYNKEKYAEALPYLEKFAEGTKISDRKDKFQLGYCYYRTGETDKAIALLRNLGTSNDLLGQNVWFILGDCYLQKGDKKRAQLGFSEASKMNFDRDITEQALFNYAKLAYEISYSPFGEVINAFQDYIEKFPASERIDEAYNYLVSSYMQVRNYKAALASLDRIPVMNSRLEEAYQRVAFYRGLELFKNMDLEAAIAMFEKSLRFEKYNRQLRARAVYWKAEADYRLGRFEEAKKGYTTYMGIPGSSILGENNLLRYNLGYALFNLEDYTNAVTHFLNFESDVANVRSDLMADARNRIADCYYINTSYPQAVAYYDKVIDFGKINADYAMFQKGFCLGLMNDMRGKTDVLTSLTTRYPSSLYVANAIFERGRAHVVLKEYDRGEADFNTVISSFPESPFVPRAMVQLGLLYYNTDQSDKAIAQYKRVIEKFRSTPEARAAMTGLKNAYVEMNDVESYFSYVKTLQGYGDINLAEKDSLLYTSGENLFIKGQYPRAAEVFSSYIAEFPSGSFRQNAQFYLAECYRRTENIDEALKLYAEVASAPVNQFTEQSLAAAAAITYSKEDYAQSLAYYERLEKVATTTDVRISSLRGWIRSAWQLGDAQKTLLVADRILSTSNVPEELIRETTFMRAKANYSLNNYETALSDFRKVATEVTTAEGAESKYRVAEILFRNDQINESEKLVSEFIDQNTPHQYWMAKIFILLSDISLKKGDKLQARVTLESLRDYYSVSDDGILEEVKARLETLNQTN
ncbi:MAG TPA: tetratricopeptide repeat protein [Bacteroidales bacterium]|nr:tetratricopeptide repeat protein [Bacteroidales bacterium]HPJ58519.1 tetratricopeptide repeat protein [Bacteroidales bacterium]HPR11694.1 tetratricopeptide repeat protein [Bacteroidales bacterium]HRW85529.1 tetratricopeptide repeat protein [Bacteroidales bacterium]